MIAKPSQQELFLTLDIFEGPLDLLLELVRRHKIDIKNLPLVQLADQYLAFLKQIETGNLAISAEYLAMAAWLVWLKSLKLLPEEKEPEEAAHSLSFRLERYAALKRAMVNLQNRPQLGREFFIRLARGLPVIEETPLADTSLSELLEAYAEMQTRKQLMTLPSPRPLYMQEDALEHLDNELAKLGTEQWVGLEELLPQRIKVKDDYYRRSVVAAVFCAALELAKNGRLAILNGERLPKIRKKADNQEQAISQ